MLPLHSYPETLDQVKYIFSSILSLGLLASISQSNAQDSAINCVSTATPTTAVKYGIASYYAKKFEGRRTTTDAIYHAALLTAACNTLPLNTWVRVTNLKNMHTVIVKINDRMNHLNKRLIDLSPAAAKQLGYLGAGLTKVKVEVIPKPKKRVA